MPGRGTWTAALALAIGVPAPATGALAEQPDAGAAQAEDARYALAGGCYALRSESLGRYVVKDRGGYRAAAEVIGAAEPFPMQATALGRYLLYGRERDFMAGEGAGVEVAGRASPAADWRVDVVSGAFRVELPSEQRSLGVSPDGRLVLAEPGGAERFAFEPTAACADFPEVEVNATGRPLEGATSYGEVRGLVDAHMHMMAFEFLGGRAHCGRPWHRYGVEHALVDCLDHYPGNGAAAVLENVLYGNPVRTHDPVGWPTFRDWPHHASLTHEQSYYKWLERAWMGGLRVFVNLMVENAALCEIYPYKKNSCNEMDSVRLQIRRIHQLEDYIDAQEGGPGKGWFRIVTDPFEARRVVNEGKLAVVLGIETSELFDCGVYNDVPQCGTEDVDRQLDEFHDLGIRDMELINKFDNAFGGVAGDAGTTGVVVNAGNRLQTGKFWQMQSCPGHVHADGHTHEGVHDRSQFSLPGVSRDSLVGNGLMALLPPGALPVYTEEPHCNARGLTALGEHLVRRMMEKGMIIDPDHLGVVARNGVLALAEAARYPGLISSHSWSTPDALPRIYALGGVVTPYAGSSTSFVKAWEETRSMRSERHYFGFGYGADMNGFGAQGAPRDHGGENPVRYPFTSFDGGVTLDRQRSGERVFDINEDGVAHYGLYPDWIEDLRMIAGEEIVEDMARGAEAYLQMWERAEGIPQRDCRSERGRMLSRGFGNVRLHATPRRLLERAGQPGERAGRVWSWCVDGRGAGESRVKAVFTPRGRVGLVTSTARAHRARRVGPGASVARLRRTRELGRGLMVRPGGRGTRLVYGVRDGRVTFVAVAARSVAARPARLRAYLRLAGLR